MTSYHDVDDQPEPQFFDPPSNPYEDDELAAFLASLETVPVDSAIFQKLAGLSPARQYTATHMPYKPKRKPFVPVSCGPLWCLNHAQVTRRRNHTFIRYPVCSIHSWPRCLQPLVKATQKLDKAINFLCPDPLAFAALGILSLCLLFAFALVAPAQAPSLETLDHPHKACKTVSDKEPRIKPKILFTTTKSFTLVLKDCRENDKQHVSCQFVDPAGKERWLYIPGLTIPHDN